MTEQADLDASGMQWWLLGQVFHHRDPDAETPMSTIDNIRTLSEDEAQAAKAAVRAVSSLRSATQVTPFEQATVEALGAMEVGLTGRVRWAFDPEEAIAPTLALDRWLSHAVVARNRMVRDVSRSLGESAGQWLEAAFRHLYRTDAEYRLVWEWRNASQHRLQPLELTTATERFGQTTLWTLSKGAIAKDNVNRKKGEWPPFVLHLADEEPDLREVIHDVWEKIADAYAGCLLVHEGAIRDHLELLTSLLMEGQESSPGARAIGRMPDLSSVAHTGANFKIDAWTPLHQRALEAMDDDVDAARRRLTNVGNRPRPKRDDAPPPHPGPVGSSASR